MACRPSAVSGLPLSHSSHPSNSSHSCASFPFYLFPFNFLLVSHIINYLTQHVYKKMCLRPAVTPGPARTKKNPQKSFDLLTPEDMKPFGVPPSGGSCPANGEPGADNGGLTTEARRPRREGNRRGTGMNPARPAAGIQAFIALRVPAGRRSDQVTLRTSCCQTDRRLRGQVPGRISWWTFTSLQLAFARYPLKLILVPDPGNSLNPRTPDSRLLPFRRGFTRRDTDFASESPCSAEDR